MTTEIQTIDAGSLTLLEIVPRQGEWNERNYLWISGGTNRLVELVNGRLEVLRPPTDQHQSILVNVFMPLSTLTKNNRWQSDIRRVAIAIMVGTFP